MKNIDHCKAGRSAAIAVALVAYGECQDKSDDFTNAFWDELASQLASNLPKHYTSVTLKPMLDEEAREFRKTQIKFGRHAEKTVASVETSDLKYLQWLVNDDFQEQLRRYLAREEFS